MYLFANSNNFEQTFLLKQVESEKTALFEQPRESLLHQQNATSIHIISQLLVNDFCKSIFKGNIPRRTCLLILPNYFYTLLRISLNAIRMKKLETGRYKLYRTHTTTYMSKITLSLRMTTKVDSA